MQPHVDLVTEKLCAAHEGGLIGTAGLKGGLSVLYFGNDGMKDGRGGRGTLLKNCRIIPGDFQVHYSPQM